MGYRAFSNYQNRGSEKHGMYGEFPDISLQKVNFKVSKIWMLPVADYWEKVSLNR